MGNPETTDATATITLEASDTTGQKAVSVDGPSDATVGELIQNLMSQMSLPRNDSNGRPLAYHARLDREGRHLHSSEILREALQPNDRIILQPNIDAGAKN